LTARTSARPTHPDHSADLTKLRQIAEAPNARGINAPRGGQWHATSVRNVMARA
jgi:hypothetical protein